VIKISIFDRFPFGKKKVSKDNDSFINDNLGLNSENMGYDRTGIPESNISDIQQADSNPGMGSEKSGFDQTGLPAHESFGSQDTSALDQTGFDSNKPSSIESYKQTQPSTTADKELELISAKLDTIKLILDDLNRRIANLEKIAKE